MAELTDPNFGLKYGWDLGESGWKDGMDSNMLKIGALIYLMVIDKDLTSPPGSESEGDIYIVGPAASGDWNGYDGYVAHYIGGAYRFYQPQKGWTAIIGDENNGRYFYNGAAWISGIAFGDGGNVILGTVVGTQFGTSTAQKLSFYGNSPVAQASGADQAEVTPGNVDDDVGGLTISAAYSQTEVQALRDACETVADDMRANNTLLNEVRSVLVDLGLMKGAA